MQPALLEGFLRVGKGLVGGGGGVVKFMHPEATTDKRIRKVIQAQTM